MANMDSTSARNSMKTSILRTFIKAAMTVLAVLATVFAISFASVEKAEAKTYTGTWTPPAITNEGWVNLSTSISVTINYVEGADTMTVSFRENWTTFGKSWLYGDGFKDGFCLITPPTTGYGDTHMMGCNSGSGPTDTHAKARNDFQSWANCQGSTLIFYASQSNKSDSDASKGGSLSSGGTYTYDLRGYKPGDTPVLLWYGNRYQTHYNGAPGQSFVHHLATLTTADFGMTIKIAPKVTSSSGPGGSITPAGTISYPYEGNSSTYTWSRNYGYALKDVIIDGTRYGASKTSHQFTRMTQNHTIAVEWLELGDISLSKVTADSLLSCTDRYSLANAQYILYTDAKCTNRAKDVDGRNVILTTDSSGKAKTSKVIYPGTYYLKESVPSKGFRLDPTVHTVVVSGGKTTSVTSKEEPQRGYITVQKNSSAPDLTQPNKCYTLKGAAYEVYRDGVKVATLTTGDDGKTNTFTAPLGRYTVKEVTPSTGFRTDKSTYSVDISSDNQSKTFNSTEVPLIDTYPLALHKMDREAEDTGHADTPQAGLSLEEAEYRVSYYDGYYSSVLETAPLTSKWSKTFKTSYDESSKAIFEVLSDEMFNDGTGQMGWLLGTYVVEETKAPYGYLIDAKAPYVMQITKATSETAESHVIPLSGARTDAGAADTHIRRDNPMLSSEEPQRANFMVMIFGEKTTDPDNSSLKTGLENVSFNIINENPYDVYCFERNVWVKPGEIVLTITSNEDGYCNTDESARSGGKDYYLPMGEYRIHPVEETIPEGYKQPDDYLLDVSVPYRTYRWIIEDKIGTVLRIEKIDADTGKRVRGFSSFEIYNLDTGEKISQQQEYPSGAVISTFTTDVTGKVTLPDKLMPGNYYIHETKAPAGYDLAEDVENDIPFTIDGDTVNTYDDPIVVQFGDHATKATLRVAVIDNDSESYINTSSSHVKVYASEDITTSDGTVRFLKGQVVFEGDTVDGKGFVDVRNLYPGKYEVVQQSAPDGYIINRTPYSVSLDYINDTTPIKGIIKIPNSAQKSNISVNLIQEDTNKPIKTPGGVFDLIADEDIITPDGTIRFNKGDVIDQITTDKTGTGMSDSPQYPGKYVLIQTDAPEGYVVEETPKRITVDYSGNDDDNQGPDVVSNHVNASQYGIINLEKKDNTSGQNVLVAGAEFAIFANEDIFTGDGTLKFHKGDKVGQMMTRSDGTATSGYLNVGNYSIEESRAPEGYMNDENKKSTATITYEEDKPYSQTASIGLSFMNQAALGNAEITKIDSETKRPLREAGIAIDIIAAEDIVTPDGVTRYKKGDLVQSALTDENGMASFENLYIGKYLAVQKTPATGYDINDDPTPFEVVYKNDKEPPETVKKDIEDDVLTGSVIIRKTVSGTEQLIASSTATFKIEADEDIVTADGTVRFHNGETVGIVKTKDGEAKIDGLYSGRYKATEIEAPYGYVMDGSEYVFDVRYNLVIENDERRYMTEESFTISNSIQKSSIVVENKDKDTGGYIKEPAIFEIRASEDIYTPEGEKIFEKGELVSTVETDSSGTAKTEDIPLGKYEIIMTTPSDGYPLDDEPKYIETTYDSQAGVEGNTFTVEYMTSMPTARIDISKLNEYDGTTPVAGASFKLVALEDIIRGDGSVIMESGAVADEADTDENGTASLSGIHQGKYVLSETKAPEGYMTCEDKNVVVSYKHGETEVLEVDVDTDADTNDKTLDADNTNSDEATDRHDEDERAIEKDGSHDVNTNLDDTSGDDTDEESKNEQENIKTADLFTVSIEVFDAPMMASISKVGPMGGHLADCELALYSYKGDAIDSDINEMNIGNLSDNFALVDTWTTIDKVEGEDEHSIEEAEQEGMLSTFEDAAHVVYPLPAGTYVLVESRAAEGYEIAEPIVFTIEERQEIAEITMVDDYADLADEMIVETGATIANEVISEYGDKIWAVLVLFFTISGSLICVTVRRKKIR